MPENLCHNLVDEVYGAVVAMSSPDRSELDALCSDALVTVLQVYKTPESTVQMCSAFSEKVTTVGTDVDVDAAKASWCRVPRNGPSFKVASLRKAVLLQPETHLQTAAVSQRKHTVAMQHHAKHSNKHTKKHHHSHLKLRARSVNQVDIGEHVQHAEEDIAAFAQSTESEAKSFASGVASFMSS